MHFHKPLLAAEAVTRFAPLKQPPPSLPCPALLTATLIQRPLHRCVLLLLTGLVINRNNWPVLAPQFQKARRDAGALEACRQRGRCSALVPPWQAQHELMRRAASSAPDHPLLHSRVIRLLGPATGAVLQQIDTSPVLEVLTSGAARPARLAQLHLTTAVPRRSAAAAHVSCPVQCRQHCWHQLPSQAYQPAQ